MCDSCFLIRFANSNFVKFAEMILSRLLVCVPVAFLRSLQKFRGAISFPPSLFLSPATLPGNRGSGRWWIRAMTRRDGFEIRNFYMCLGGTDFRICRQCLPSVARVLPPFPIIPFSPSHSPIFPSGVCEVPRHLEKGIKTSRGMRGGSGIRSIQGGSP